MLERDFRFGLQRGFGERAPNGLPTEMKLLPGYLQDVGYTTHMLGKWHLGHCHAGYTPTSRGFTTFLGSYSGGTDHWTREGGTRRHRGYDLRNGTCVTQHGRGQLSSELYTDLAVDLIHNMRGSQQPHFLYLAFTMIHSPFQDVAKKYAKQENVSKKLRDGMIRALDEAVGRILSVVDDSTILVFMSDNGGRNYAEEGIHPNLPLRGGKTELYEGGTRVLGYIQGPGIRKAAEYGGMMHMVDWLPTLLSLAGGQ